MKVKTVKTILIICAVALLFAGLSYYIIFGLDKFLSVGLTKASTPIVFYPY